jgi:hypothetical protein
MPLPHLASDAPRPRQPRPLDYVGRMRAQLAPDLIATLDLVVPAAGELADPWWLFGSAAMALLGVEDLTIADVDLLTSEADAHRLLARLGASPAAAGGSALFRSRVFGRATGLPLPVEVMAGFEVREGQGWTAVAPKTRLAIDWSGGPLHIPSAAEQAALCRRFGRPKDLLRAAALERLAKS